MKISKVLLIVLSMLFCIKSYASDVVRVDGNDNAPVVIQEFSSLTCPSCANYHSTIYPELKKKYIETGKVKVIYHNYPLDNVAMAASMLGLSMPKNKYFDYLQFAFANQNKLDSDPLNTIYQWGRIVGFNKSKVDSILKNQKLMNEISADMKKTNRVYQLKGTPLIYIGKTRFEGFPDKKKFFAEIDKQLSK